MPSRGSFFHLPLSPSCNFRALKFEKYVDGFIAKRLLQGVHDSNKGFTIRTRRKSLFQPCGCATLTNEVDQLNQPSLFAKLNRRLFILFTGTRSENEMRHGSCKASHQPLTVPLFSLLFFVLYFFAKCMQLVRFQMLCL